MSTNKVYDKPKFKEQYDNYINGKWTPPASGKYFDVITPLDGTVMSKAAHSNTQDLDLAVDAAVKLILKHGKTSATERSIIVNKITRPNRANLEYIAVEITDNGNLYAAFHSPLTFRWQLITFVILQVLYVQKKDH